ncbi:MAG TPA: tetratricopeptide repeat protein [Bryobacteraceae bacterium]|nr:tetratricopeptide repeat protein [Bryobacteraceae bacterium]
MKTPVKLLCSASAVLMLTSWTTGCIRTPQYYVKEGNKFFAKGKYVDASLNYRKAIQKDTKNGEAYYRLGLAAIEQKDSNEAVAALSRALELQPDNQDARTKIADIYLNTYLLDSSRPKALYTRLTTLAEEFLAKNAQSFAGLRLKGYLALTDRKSRDAAEYFKRAYEVQSTDEGVASSWVQALFLDGRFQEGETLALKLIKDHSNFGGVYDRLAERYTSTGRFADAESILRMKIANNPRNGLYAFQLAAYYVHEHRGADAEAVLKRLLDDPKTFPNARLQVGDFYYELRDWQRSIGYYEDGLRSDSKQALAYQERITDALLAQGKRAEAAQMVDTILKSNPNNVDARRVHATLLASGASSQDVTTAISEFQSLIKSNPGNANLFYRLGNIYLRTGDLNAARSNFEEALKARADFLLPRYPLAEISLQQQRPQAAVRYAAGILAVRPNDPQAMLLHASGLMDGGDNASARQELTALLKQVPQDVDAQVQLGLLDIKDGKLKEAADLFQRLRQTYKDDSRPAAGLAETYIAQNRVDEAFQVLNSAGAGSSTSPVIRLELAKVAMRAHKYDVAVREYRELAAQNPKSLDLSLSLAEAYQLGGDLQSAVAAFQEAVKLAPNDPVPLMFLGDALWKANRIEEAQLNYRHALQLQPDNPSALNNLAFLLAETSNNLDEALRLAQRAVQKAPQDPSLKDTLGWVYLKQNGTDSALQIFANLVRQYPNEPLFRYHLGVALFKHGEKAKARTELTMALSKGPQRADEQKIRELIAKMN